MDEIQKIQKPLSVLVDELKKNISDNINNSQLHPYILEQIMKEFYMEVHQIYIQQTQAEKEAYEKSLSENIKNKEEEVNGGNL